MASPEVSAAQEVSLSQNGLVELGPTPLAPYTEKVAFSATGSMKLQRIVLFVFGLLLVLAGSASFRPLWSASAGYEGNLVFAPAEIAVGVILFYCAIRW